MNKQDFHSPQAGQAIFTPRGYWAFIPAPLPPEISYNPSLVLALSRADAALSELSGLGRHIINPHLRLHPMSAKKLSFLQGLKERAPALLIY